MENTIWVILVSVLVWCVTSCSPKFNHLTVEKIGDDSTHYCRSPLKRLYVGKLDTLFKEGDRILVSKLKEDSSKHFIFKIQK